MPLVVREDYFVMVSHSSNRISHKVIITGITEGEELLLDDGHAITITRGDMIFVIEPKDIVAYGIIDFSTNSEDYETIEEFRYLDHLGLFGVSIPANYHYDEHCAYSDTNRYKTFDTTNPARLAQYAHGFIGKPERSLIFKWTRK